MDLEKDIKRCKDLTKLEHANWLGISNQLAILHILEDYEMQKQINYGHKKINGELREKIKELEAKLEFKQWGDLDDIRFEEYISDLIQASKGSIKADETFEKLGYKKIEDKYNIDFNKIYSFTSGDKIQEKIRFCKLDKYIHVENYNYDSGITFGKYLDKEELKAISLKLKELKWV